ncbi:MAG TPA: hypothetical protein PKM01_11905 [Anaerolineaceae bacterium]|nr:hypothetical protein [Anaerolineaceae bacterium]
MAKLILAADRIARARALIQEARDLPIPVDGGKFNFTYIAQVKDLLRQARDLVKYIHARPGATADVKEDAKRVLAEADQANQEILH